MSKHESKISTRVRDKARKLAKTGVSADNLAASLLIPLDTAEEIIADVNEARQVDLLAIKNADRARLNLDEPTRELFVELFRKRDRQRIIEQAILLVRKYVGEHVAQHKAYWKADDLEQTVLIAVIEETDRLLAKDCEHSNPGSMLIDAIKAAIFDPPRDYLSTPHIIVRPRGQNARHKTVEISVNHTSLNPKARDDDGFFTGGTEAFDPSGQRQGQRRNRQRMVVPDHNDDRWELLAELCDETEMMVLQLLSHGHTRQYVAEAIGCHVSTVSTILSTIKAKVQRQRERDGDL